VTEGTLTGALLYILYKGNLLEESVPKLGVIFTFYKTGIIGMVLKVQLATNLDRCEP
jgi:hypothetical protein